MRARTRTRTHRVHVHRYDARHCGVASLNRRGSQWSCVSRRVAVTATGAQFAFTCIYINAYTPTRYELILRSRFTVMHCPVFTDTDTISLPFRRHSELRQRHASHKSSKVVRANCFRVIMPCMYHVFVLSLHLTP